MKANEQPPHSASSRLNVEDTWTPGKRRLAHEKRRPVTKAQQHPRKLSRISRRRGR